MPSAFRSDCKIVARCSLLVIHFPIRLLLRATSHEQRVTSNDMTFFKPLELAFRRGLIRFLGRVARRNASRVTIPEKANVLFLRQDRIGDLLVSTAIIHALASAKPLWQIDMLLGKSNVAILEHDPVIRRRWFYDKKISSTIKLIRALRRERYDIVIDLMDNPSATSTALVALAGGAVNVGLKKENGFAYDIAVPMRSRDDTHIVERLADMLRAIGCEVRDSELRLHYTPGEASRKRAREFFSPYRPSGKKICCVNTSAGSVSRFWGEENYRMFLRETIRVFPDILFFVAAQPVDAERAQKICAGILGAHLLAVSGSFDEFAALVAEADIVITPDTSVVHLASALGKPEVVLYDSKAMAINWSPYGVPFRVVISRDGTMTSIAPKEVLEALQSLITEM